MVDDSSSHGPAPNSLPTYDELEPRPFKGIAQQHRLTELKTARGILLGVGIVSIAFNLFLFAYARSLTDGAFEKEMQILRAQGKDVDPAVVEELKESDVRARQVMAGLMASMGLVFCVLAFFVSKYPLFSTASGLLIYIGTQGLLAYMDLTTIFSGILIKILIFIALASAVKTAMAYERQSRQTRDVEGPT